MRGLLVMLALFSLSPIRGWGLDVMRMEGGRAIRGRVEAITHETVSVRVIVDLGGGNRGEVKRVYRLARVEHIEFGSTENELRLLNLGELASRDALRKLWDEKVQYLAQARSGTGRIGLLYAKAFMKSDSTYHWGQAMELYDLIEEKSWWKEDREDARIGRIRVLVRQGNLAKARSAASDEIENNKGEKTVVEAHYLLGEIAFIRLKGLQRENPKWEEDDEVRPERMRIYNEALDHFLDPYLFHAPWDEQAARGLMDAAGVYRFAGDLERAAQCLEDVVQMYPSTSAGNKAAQDLKTLKQ